MGAELHMEIGAGEEQALIEWLQRDGEFLGLSG